jgi:hypothetical protein
MAMQYAAPPEGAQQVAGQGVEAVVRTARMKTSGGRALTMTAPEQLALTAPHAMYNVSLAAIINEVPIDDAPQTAWRYLVDAGDGAVASSEVAIAPGGQLTFAQLNEGPFVAGTEQALRDAEQIPEVANGNYEARVLRVPALDVAALWLKDLDGGDDLIVPLDPSPPFLVAGRVYRERELYAALAGPARERADFDDSPQA